MKLSAEVTARGGMYVGASRDRNLRRLYRIDRTMHAFSHARRAGEGDVRP
jgi:hypothetical protein